MKTFVGITGTTCVGKSAVAVELAKILHTEIVSADSMQIYKGMDIGTAKVTAEEMQGIKHHMLDVVCPNEPFSSFQYQQQASEIIDKIALPIVVGGTGFYFDSLLYPPEFGEGNQLRRKELQQILRMEGLQKICEMLKEEDEYAYQTVDLSNPVRVVRALEIAEKGGKRALGRGKTQPRYNCLLFVLQRERASLYQMIDQRVDKMVENGLIDEVNQMVDLYGVCDTPAFAAIGYKEIVEFLQRNCTREQAIDRIKLNTRHYAKRQITYFKKMNVCKFLDVEGKTSRQIAEIILAELNNLCLSQCKLP